MLLRSHFLISCTLYHFLVLLYCDYYFLCWLYYIFLLLLLCINTWNCSYCMDCMDYLLLHFYIIVHFHYNEVLIIHIVLLFFYVHVHCYCIVIVIVLFSHITKYHLTPTIIPTTTPTHALVLSSLGLGASWSTSGYSSIGSSPGNTPSTLPCGLHHG